jgi:hypothetical protein
MYSQKMDPLVADVGFPNMEMKQQITPPPTPSFVECSDDEDQNMAQGIVGSVSDFNDESLPLIQGLP